MPITCRRVSWRHWNVTVHHSTALPFLCTMVGSDQLLLGTDYPFPVADPDPLRLYAQAGFADADIAAMAGGNTQALFRLEGRTKKLEGACCPLLPVTSHVSAYRMLSTPLEASIHD